MSSEVEERVSELEEMELRVQKVWEETRLLYEEERDISLLQRELEQAERWLSSYENTLTSKDFGDSVSDVMELLKRQEDLEAMIQAQSERFVALQKKKTKREKRLHGHEDTEDRKPPVRVSSLRRKPSDPKTSRSSLSSSSSSSIVRRLSSGRRTDRTIRSMLDTRTPSLTPPASPPPSPSLHPDSRRHLSVSRRRQETKENTSSPPASPVLTVTPWRSRTSQSDAPLRVSPDSSSSKRPPSPPPFISSSPPEGLRRPRSKPPLAPKPRIPPTYARQSETPEKPATSPDSPPPIRELAAPTEPPPPPIRELAAPTEPPPPPIRELAAPTEPPPPPIRELAAPTEPPPPPIRELAVPTEPPPVAEIRYPPESPPSRTRKALHNEPPDSPPPAEQVTPPDSPTAPPITEQDAGSADLAPPTRELPPSPSLRHGKLEDLPEEDASSTPEVTAEQPIRMEGMLEIKLKQGGNKEHWEEVFAVLEGGTLSLFKDRAAAAERTSRWPPISMDGSVCRENVFYRRKENTFKLILQDGSQYLFAASSREQQLLWVKKLQNGPESASSDSDDSGRASSVNLSLEKLAEAPDDSNKPADSRAESLERQSSTEGQPPPKPPHTYYNKHRYPEDGEAGAAGSLRRQTLPPSVPPPPPPAVTPQLSDDGSSKSRRSVFRKFFTKK